MICFSYISQDKCGALRTRECVGCSFFKSPECHRADRDNAMRRLRKLDPATREMIKLKYGLVVEESGEECAV